MTRLLLAEYDRQVDDLLRRGSGAADEWVALGPSAMARLDEEGVAYRIPEDFVPLEEIRGFCEDRHEQVERLCDEIDAALWAEHPELAAADVRPGLFNIHALMVLFDTTMGRIFKLARIFRAVCPERVVVHRGARPTLAPSTIGFVTGESLWGWIAAFPEWGLPSEVLADPAPRDGGHVLPGRRLAAVQRRIGIRLTRRSPRLRHAVRSLVAGDIRRVAEVLRTRGAGTMLVLNGRQEWQCAAPLLRARGWRVLYVVENDFAPAGRGHVAALPASLEPAVARCATAEGISAAELLWPIVVRLCGSVRGQFEAALGRLGTLHERNGVRAILASTCNKGLGHAVLQAARTIGLPTFVWQHGFVVPTPERASQFNDYNDRIGADVTFVYGPEVERAYRASRRPMASQVVSVGSASVDRLQAEETARGPAGEPGSLHILYVTTNYYGNAWYLGFPPGWSDGLFCRDQAVIVEALARLAHSCRATVTIKLHPAYECEDPPWARRLERSARLRLVKDEHAMPALLARADVVVLDFPSTTLLQCAATDVTLFVLTRHLELPPDARRLLAARAVCDDDATALVRLLVEAVHGDDPRLRDRAFLRAFGTHLDDRRSAQRAVARVVAELGAEDPIRQAHALAGAVR